MTCTYVSCLFAMCIIINHNDNTIQYNTIKFISTFIHVSYYRTLNGSEQLEQLNNYMSDVSYKLIIN